MNLVTGATGMLGIHVLHALILRGEKVRALKRTLSDMQVVKNIFAHYHPDANHYNQIEWVEGDVLDVPSLVQAIEGCSHVYHCAAIVSYHKKDREQMYAVNVEGTANVVNACLEMKIDKLCFVSSIAALGKTKHNEWLSESSEWTESNYNTHYGITKNLSEMEVWRGIQEGLNAIVVNPGFIIGPGNFDRSSASIFKKLDEGMSYYPPGGTGFVGIEDCAGMMVDLMKNDVAGERFILVSDNQSMKELFQQVAQSVGKKTPHKEAGSGILRLALIGEWLKEKLTGKKAIVTAESVRNASVRFYYENKKVKELLGKEFSPISNSITNAASFYLKEIAR